MPKTTLSYTIFVYTCFFLVIFLRVVLNSSFPGFLKVFQIFLWTLAVYFTHFHSSLALGFQGLDLAWKD